MASCGFVGYGFVRFALLLVFRLVCFICLGCCGCACCGLGLFCLTSWGFVLFTGVWISWIALIWLL